MMPKNWWGALCALIVSGSALVHAAVPRDYSVELSADVSASPARITLQWPQHPTANGYTIFRKSIYDQGWTQIGTAGGGANNFTDSNVQTGQAYEYQVKKTSTEGYTGYGFIYAGIQAPLIESRGKVVLLVDNRFSGPLSGELARLQRDLVGDGWTVVRHDVSPDASVPSVKELIRNAYYADPGKVRSVFLFGKIPVPYSGNIMPDGHENHEGAWPADVYYADVDGNWTDNTVNTKLAEREINWNVPGDGRFDQSLLPSPADLMIGRVDLSNMTCFSNKNPSRSELDLLRQYLNKDHAFRHRHFTAERRGIITDNFGFRTGDPIVGSAWRNMTAFFGPGKVQEAPVNSWLSAVTSGSYLWSWGAGGGSYYYSSGIATSDDFALQDIRAVFTMFLGSYYGDWNNESNFLRAPLGSTSHTLTCSYSGFPHTFYHHMALGEPIGLGIQLAQNNDGSMYPVMVQGMNEVHIALMGDPTLRLHPVIPPSNLTGSSSGSGVRLTWNASSDTALQGYHVYRSTSENGPFDRVTSAPVQGTTHTDPAPQGRFTYMVRAIKLEASGSGTYYNPSQGIFATVDSTGGGTEPTAPPTGLSAVALSKNAVRLRWNDNSNNETQFLIERRRDGEGFAQIGTVGANVDTYEDTGLSAGTKYYYRVRAGNSGGTTAFSNESEVTTQAEPVPTVPSVPAGVAATATAHNQVRVTWTDTSANENGFKIERLTGNGSFAEIAQTGANTTSFTDTTATASTSYKYRIIAFNGVGVSAASVEATVTTPAAPPMPPAAASEAAAVALAHNRVRITWKDNSANEGGFIVERRSGSTWFNQVGLVPVNSQSYEDATVAPNTSYFYRVIAFNDVGGGQPSAEAAVTTPVEPQLPPVAPSGFTATATAHDVVNLSWTDNSNNEAGFRILRGLPGGEFGQVAQVFGNVTTYADGDVAPSRTYVYKVVAFNAVGESAATAAVTVTTPAPPIVRPIAPSELTAAIVDGKVELRWKDNSTNEVNFRVDRRTADGPLAQHALVEANASVYVDATVAPETTYTYQLLAVNEAGSTTAGEVTITTPPAPVVIPAAPVNLTASINAAGDIALAWTDASPNEVGFRIERKVGTGEFAPFATVDAGASAHVDTSAELDTTYVYRIAAFNSAGASAFSEVSITTPPAPPVAPSDFAVSAMAHNRVTLVWRDNSANESGFRIMRRGATGEFELLAEVEAGAVSYADNAVLAQTTYQYKLSAFNAGGETAGGGTLQVTTPSAPQINDEVRIDEFAVAGNTITFRIRGPLAQGVRVESSGDLTVWNSIGEGTLTTGSMEFEHVESEPGKRRFYRVRKQ